METSTGGESATLRTAGARSRAEDSAGPLFPPVPVEREREREREPKRQQASKQERERERERERAHTCAERGASVPFSWLC